jgi:ZIP family zinc transporter
MVEIFPKALEATSGGLGTRPGAWLTVASFFGGIALIAAIDRLVPKAENPHEIHRAEEMARPAPRNRERELLRMGGMTALAVAIHNVPEGIAVAVPIYYATGSRRKAFAYSFLSGLSEPVGAVIGYLLFLPFMSDLLFGILFALVAGVMVYSSLDELLPSAREYGEHHYCIGGLIAGMLVMAVSLVLFM